MSAYTTQDLLRTIKQRGMLPSNQSTWQTEDFLRQATEIMRLDLMGELVSLHEDYFVTKKIYPLAEGSSPRFKLPNRATSMSLKGVYLVESDGRNRIPIPRQDRDLSDFTTTGYRQTEYYLEWNDIVLSTTSAFEGKHLQVDYYIEPGKLVEANRAATVVSVSGNVVEVAGIPTPFSDSHKYDFISHSGGREYYGIDFAVSEIDPITNEITFVGEMPSGLAPGDYIAVAGESPTPQLPNSLQPILAQMVIVDVLNSLGFEGQASKLEARNEKMLLNALKTVTPRVDGSEKKIITGFKRRSRFE